MKHLRLFFPVVSAFALASACAPVDTNQPAASASASPTPSETPPTSPAASPQTSAPPPVTPTVTPTPAQSAAAPNPSPSATSSPAATPAPIVSGLDISTVENTTFNGKVFDLTGASLDGVKIVARSLSDSNAYSAEASTVGGSYTFNNAPAGIQIEIVATKPGYAPRRRVEVLKSNKTGDPKLNRYDFGTDGTADSSGSASNALTDSPEVIEVSPGRNATGIKANTGFSLTFSEPMERATVERSFSIRAYNDIKLTADQGAPGPTFAGDGKPATVTNTLIWDKNAFDISWNSSSTQVNFTFKQDKSLPADKDGSKTASYAIVFNNGGSRSISDQTGAARSSAHFRLTDSALEESVHFTVLPDTDPPYLAALNAQTAENGGSNGDSLQIVYSKPMQIPTSTHTVAGGMDDRANLPGSETRAPAGHPESAGNATERNVAKNYAVQITQAGGEFLTMNWFALGGSAFYDGRDASFRTVLLAPPRQGALSAVVGGAPANGDTISGTALLKNGSTVPFASLPIRLQSSLTADHVAAGANLFNAATETISFFYTDGSSEVNVDLSNPAANTYAALRNSLGALTSGGAADWTVSELQSGGAMAGNGNVEANDRVNLALAANATRNNKPIGWIELNGGIFAASQLNMPGYIVTTSPLRATQTALNAGFDLTGGRFNLVEIDAAGGAGVLAAGDQLSFTLGALPRIANKTVLDITLNPSGLFAAGKLNTPTGGYLIYPNTAVGDRVDLFQPGDAIQVTVANTVIDPAGNSIDTARNRVTATAS